MFRHPCLLRAKSAVVIFIALALLSTPLLYLSSPVTAATITIKPGPSESQDVFLDSYSSNYNYEDNGLMYVGKIDDNEYRSTSYVLLRFDLTDQPMMVTSAVLQLVLYDIYGDAFAVGTHRVNSVWDADTVTWNTIPTFEAIPAATTSGTGVSGSVWEWDVTTLYNSWQSGTPNYGVLLKSVSDELNARMGFVESMGESPPDMYPRLVLTYDEVTTYTVTFDSVGGSAVTPAEVPAGGLVTKPQDPVLAGYYIDGWFRESTCETEWQFETDVVEGNITLYAKWVPQPTPTLSPTPTPTPSPTPTAAPVSTPTPTLTPEVIPDTGEHSSETPSLWVAVLLIGGVLLVITRRHFLKKGAQ